MQIVPQQLLGQVCKEKGESLFLDNETFLLVSCFLLSIYVSCVGAGQIRRHLRPRENRGAAGHGLGLLGRERHDTREEGRT